MKDNKIKRSTHYTLKLVCADDKNGKSLNKTQSFTFIPQCPIQKHNIRIRTFNSFANFLPSQQQSLFLFIKRRSPNFLPKTRRRYDIQYMPLKPKKRSLTPWSSVNFFVEFGNRFVKLTPSSEGKLS